MIKRKRVKLEFKKPTRTQKQFKEECDINNILRRFNTTGQLPDMIKRNPVFGNFADVADYQSALNTVITAQEQFEALNSRLRNRFNNDPAQFLEFMANKDNLLEMIKLGLAKPPKKGISDSDYVSGGNAAAAGESQGNEAVKNS